ncbi:MAG: hypothetical protein MI975_09075 [Cytophagales bacterium]|nr:hypothetical protein [Cytophagales bacterium]
MRKIAFFLAIVVVSINGFSQKTFVDPHLRQIQHCKFFQKKEKLKRNTKDNRFSHIKTTYNIDLAEDDPKVDILFEFNGNISELERNNIKINTKIGNIYTSKIPLSKIDVLENIMGVKEIELGRPLEPEMDVSRPYIGLDQAHATFPYRGNGV